MNTHSTACQQRCTCICLSALSYFFPPTVFFFASCSTGATRLTSLGMFAAAGFCSVFNFPVLFPVLRFTTQLDCNAPRQPLLFSFNFHPLPSQSALVLSICWPPQIQIHTYMLDISICQPLWQIQKEVHRFFVLLLFRYSSSGFVPLYTF